MVRARLTAPSLSRLGDVGYGGLSLHGDLVLMGCPWLVWGSCLMHCRNIFLSHSGPRAGWALSFQRFAALTLTIVVYLLL